MVQYRNSYPTSLFYKTVCDILVDENEFKLGLSFSFHTPSSVENLFSQAEGEGSCSPSFASFLIVKGWIGCTGLFTGDPLKGKNTFSSLWIFLNYNIHNSTLCFPSSKPSHIPFLSLFQIHGLSAHKYVYSTQCVQYNLGVCFQEWLLDILSWKTLFLPPSPFLNRL